MSFLGDYIINVTRAHLTELLAIFIVILSVIWLWLTYNYNYWKRQNMPFIKPIWLFGNMKDIITFDNNPAEHFQELYNHKIAADQPAIGFFLFNKPCLLIREPELVKSILIKDFHKFGNRYTASDPHYDPLGAENLFLVKNPQWKEIRVKLTPVFTSGKMKQMFPLIEEIGNELDSYLCSLPVDPKTNMSRQEIKEINALYTTDVIATVAYGVHANSLKQPNGDFRTNGKRIFHFTRRRAYEFLAMFFWPKLIKLLRIQVFSKETSHFLRSTITYVMNERIKSGNKRNDLIDILVSYKKIADTAPADTKEFVFKGDTLIAQAAIFFSAGFETSSATMSFALYEISKRPDVQKRLRDEIREYLMKNDGKLTYEMVIEMPYMNMIVQEVLRLYPPLPFLDRECTLNEAEQAEGYSLKPYCDFSVPNNMPIYVPIYAMQRDPKYFPNPNKFDPERFSAENKHNINNLAYMPFGTGPHNCIGERFALIQTKVGLINFLRNHYVIPCADSHPEMILEPRALVIQSKGGIYCNIVRDPLL